MTMEKILERANAALDTAAANKYIPDFVWRRCKGVAIISCTELGFAFSLSQGDGVVIKRHEDEGTWGPPSSITFTSAGAGLIFGGADKHIFLFPMTVYGLKMLCGDTATTVGVQFGVTAGPHGREAQAGGGSGSDGGDVSYKDVTYSYVFSSGALLDVGINGMTIKAAHTQNTGFYGKDAEPLHIVCTEDTVRIPEGKGVEEIHEKLAKLSRKGQEGGDEAKESTKEGEGTKAEA